MSPRAKKAAAPPSPKKGARPADTPARAFAELAGDLMLRTCEAEPVWATNLGFHEYDGRLPDYSQATRRRYLEELEELEGEFKAVDLDALEIDDQIDHAVIFNHLELQGLNEHRLQPLVRDPIEWNRVLGEGLNALVTRSFAPLPARIRAFHRRVAQVPAFLAAAREVLEPVSKPHLEVALGQLPGMVDLVHLFDGHEHAPAGLGRASQRAAAALHAHRAFLERRLERADGDSWRLGRDLYRRKLVLTLDTGKTPDELQQAAEREVGRIQREMLALATSMLGGAARGKAGKDGRGPLEPPRAGKAEPPLTASERAQVRAALDKVAELRPSRDGLVEACRDAVGETERWMRKAALVPELPADRLLVAPWPEFGRGVAVACLDAPGPFDGPEVESYFYMCPVPEDWPAPRAESFLREYNLSQLRVLAAHEGWPGHHLQIAKARKKGSLPRAAWPSGTFVEGWAVYCEQLLIETGFRGGDPAVALAAWKMRLRTSLNKLIDQWMHCGEKTPDECLAVLLEDGFQERKEAEGKIVRAKVTACQLSTYFAGLYEVNELRDAWRKSRGGRYELAGFHGALLDHGSVAPRHLARLLLT